MKMNSFYSGKLGITLAVVASLTLSGCRSGGAWRMPGASMFASSREPDAATLAGKDAAMAVPELPVSPASKYSPDSIASVGARPASPTAGSSSTASTTAGAYGFPAQTVASPKTGLAATANGYQTGPYQMGSASSTSTAGLATGSATPAGYPNPYGGSYSGTTTAPDIGLPKSVTGALANAASTMPSYPSSNGTSTPTYSGTGGYGPAATTAQTAPGMGANSYAGYGTASSAPASYPTGSYPGTPVTGSSPVATASAGGTAATQYPSPSLPALPAMPNATTGQVAGAQTPASSAYQGATTLSGGYSPGTTGRSTGYNFGPSSTGTTPTAGGTSAAPMSSFPPNTATAPNSSLVR